MTKTSEFVNHLLIVGYGGFGRAVAGRMRKLDRAVLVVERDPARAQRAREAGHGVRQGSLLEFAPDQLGLTRASHALITEEDDELALAATLCLRQAREDLPITTLVERERCIPLAKAAGATRVLSLWLDTALELCDWLASPRVSRFTQPAESGGAGMSEITIAGGSQLVGRTLASLGRDEASSVSYVALERPGEEMQIPPRGTESLREGDVLMVWGDPDQVSWLRRKGCAVALEKRAHPAPAG